MVERSEGAEEPCSSSTSSVQPEWELEPCSGAPSASSSSVEDFTIMV